MTDATSKYGHALTQLRACLEDELLHEGFIDGLPADIKPIHFDLRKSRDDLWFAIVILLFYLPSLLVSSYGFSTNNSCLVFLVPGIASLCYFLSERRIFRTRGYQRHAFGSFQMLFVFILIVMYTRSIEVGYWYLGFAFGGFLIYWLAVSRSYRIGGLKELARALSRALPQSLAFTFTLAPILITLLLLSELSQELWQILAARNAIIIIVSALWVVLPVLIGVIATVIREPRQVSENASRILPSVDAPTREQALDIPCVIDALSDIDKSELDILWGSLWPRILDEPSNERLAGYIERAVRNELMLLFLFLNVALGITFFVYFSILFNLLLDDSVLMQWIGNTYPIPKLELFGQQFYSLTSGPVAGVTTFFTIMSAGIANVQIVADEARHEDFVNLYSRRGERWMAISALLRAVDQELANLPTVTPEAVK